MFAGTGGVGVKDMPSEHTRIMPKKCVACHMYREEGEGGGKREEGKEKGGGHTFRPDDRGCLKCHENPQALAEEWQKKVSPLMEQLRSLLDNAPDKTTESYKAAKSNYDMVKSDGGLGIHNPGYAQALLLYSISSLKAKSLWKQ